MCKTQYWPTFSGFNKNYRNGVKIECEKKKLKNQVNDNNNDDEVLK